MDTYEKKYKELVAKIKNAHLYAQTDSTKNVLEGILPELAESEDERMMHQLHSWMKEFGGAEEYTEKVYTWLKSLLEKQAQTFTKRDVDEAFVEGMAFAKNELEKQGKQKTSLSEEDERIRKAILELVRQSSEVLDRQNQNNMIAWLEKQGQKPFDYENANIQQKDFAPMDEPMFKVGNWVVNKLGNIWHIDSFDNKNYKVTDINGNHNYFPISIQDRMHLWTIQDAKDGDVLHSPSHRLIWIYKDNKHYHASININYVTENIPIDGLIKIPSDVCPATTVQRAILFSKMEGASYTWNADKKQLKKIEKEPQRMISAEAKEALYDKPTDNDMVEALRTEYEKGKADAIAETQKHNDAIKPKFNVGDYIVSNSGLKYYITGIFKGYYMTESGCIITLGAQDNYKVYNNFWSKEEEELLNNICNLLQNPDSIKANQHVIGNIVDWLKSLKQRYTWKPSDEQMEVLLSEVKGWTKGCPKQIVLESLYNDLKRLLKIN